MADDLKELFEGAEEDLANKPDRKRLESERQADAMAAARKAGWYAYKWRSARQSGVLDVIYLRPVRRIVFIEYKVPGNKPSKLQIAVAKILTACGFPCYICYDVEDTLERLARH